MKKETVSLELNTDGIFYKLYGLFVFYENENNPDDILTDMIGGLVFTNMNDAQISLEAFQKSLDDGTNKINEIEGYEFVEVIVSDLELSTKPWHFQGC